MEFVAKQKKLKVTIGGVSHEMRCPTIGERQDFFKKLNQAKPEEAVNEYSEWFSTLGLPKKAILGLDSDDFVSFIEFVIDPKKKQMS